MDSRFTVMPFRSHSRACTLFIDGADVDNPRSLHTGRYPGVFAAQMPMYGDEEQCRDHFSSVVLIEAVVSEADERFSLSDLTQPNATYPHGAAQAAWDEGLLSGDGEVLLARTIN